MDNDELTKRVKWYEKQYGPYIEKRGLTKQNVKNLFKWPTLQEWTILVLIMMALFLGWAYKTDINACYSFIDELTIVPLENINLSQFYNNNYTLILEEEDDGIT